MELELEEVLKRFGTMCALTPEEAKKEEALCRGAIAQVERERGCRPGGEDALADYAAAIACRRFVLRCLMCGGTVAIGDPRSGPAGAREAAEALTAEYRRAASRWLGPEVLRLKSTVG